MDAQHHAEFLERIGHTVRECNGVYWFDTFSRAFTTIPYDVQIDPAASPARDVLGSDGLLVRYSCDVADGVPSFQHVVTDKNYGMETLINKARNKTRQGLRKCEAGPVDPLELGDEGVQLHAETLLRQGRRLSDNFESYWKQYFAAASANPCATAWAAWYEGKLASYLISFRAGAREYISIVRSSQELLKHRPNNAMLYTFLEHTMARPEIDEVSIGLQSLQPGGESLDLFKRGMGFQERPIGQRIELRSPLTAALPGPVAALAARTLKLLPGGEKQARLSGALNWYATQPRVRRAA
ncbi:MAG: hypothetical protein Fues2KO_32600 [Fuerstiella sp.]